MLRPQPSPGDVDQRQTHVRRPYLRRSLLDDQDACCSHRARLEPRTIIRECFKGQKERKGRKEVGSLCVKKQRGIVARPSAAVHRNLVPSSRTEGPVLSSPLLIKQTRAQEEVVVAGEKARRKTVVKARVLREAVEGESRRVT